MRVLRSRRVAALLVTSAAILVTAACGGGGDEAAPAGGENAFTAYTQCLKENGVTVIMPSGQARPSGMPRPSDGVRPSGGAGRAGGGFGRPADVDDATWEKAQTACSSLRPAGRPDGGGPGDAGPGGGPGGGGPGRGADAAYQNCLRDHSAAPDSKEAEACEVLKPSTGS